MQQSEKLYAQNSTFSELHVTGLGSLEEVRIENNHLTDLDLTGLTSLRALSCYGNQLHTLDARPAAALEVLQADSNGMESLLVEGLENLKHFIVRITTCSRSHSQVWEHWRNLTQQITV